MIDRGFPGNFRLIYFEELYSEIIEIHTSGGTLCQQLLMLPVNPGG